MARKTNFFKKRWKELLLLFFAIVFSLLLAEIVFRIIFPDPYLHHPVYGWARQPFYSEVKGVIDDKDSIKYVNFTYSDFGFKRWGDVNSSRKKVLIIGDSFTEMVFVNNGEEWYSYLERAFPDVEFFVIGIGGYGSLQEYMILRDYYDVIKPDVIIWQFYFNDFQNNYFPSERYAYPSTNQVERPFLENGKIVMRLPVPLGALRERSRLVGLIMHRYDLFRENDLKDRDVFYSHLYGDDFWGKDFSKSKVFLGRFDEVFNVTAEIFSMARRKVGDTPVYFFSVDTRLEEYERKLCNLTGMIYIPDVYSTLLKYNQKKNVFVINDGHWNLEGNRVAGEYLVEYFKPILSTS